MSLSRVSITVFTIGHSSHTAESFAGLLQGQGVECLADVRSQPASRFAPQFSRAALEGGLAGAGIAYRRSEEHTSELQSLMRISYAVFCLQKQNIIDTNNTDTRQQL